MPAKYRLVVRILLRWLPADCVPAEARLVVTLMSGDLSVGLKLYARDRGTSKPRAGAAAPSDRATCDIARDIFQGV